jgi:hypothetical protein
VKEAPTGGGPVRSRLGEVQDLEEGLPDPGHQRRRELRQWTPNEPPVVDGAELVDEEIGLLAQAPEGGNADAERLGIVDEIGRQGNHQRRRVPGIQEA